MSHQGGGLLGGPGQDCAARAVRDDDHRVAGAELFDLGDEQLAGLVEADVGHRRGLAGQQAGVEGPAGEGRRVPGAQPVPGHVHGQGPGTRTGHPGQNLGPAPASVPGTVQKQDRRFPRRHRRSPSRPGRKSKRRAGRPPRGRTGAWGNLDAADTAGHSGPAPGTASRCWPRCCSPASSRSRPAAAAPAAAPAAGKPPPARRRGTSRAPPRAPTPRPGLATAYRTPPSAAGRR